VLPLFVTPQTHLNANAVCRALCLPISKIRRVRSALRRLVKDGDLFETVHPRMAGARNATPIYSLATPIEEDDGKAKQTIILPQAENKHLKQQTTPPSQPPSSLLVPASMTDPLSPSVPTPRNACAICFRSRSVVVFWPCKHQVVCQSCWSQYQEEKSVTRRKRRLLPHDDEERRPRPFKCQVCRERGWELLS